MGTSTGTGVFSVVSNGTTRFAPYIESAHEDMLTTTRRYVNSAITESPYTDYEDIDTVNSFLGIGLTLSSFSSLYDMYGKFMAGFDVEAVWGNTVSRLFADYEVTTAEKSEELEDSVVSRRAEIGLRARNLNAVGSSSYLIDLARIENAFVVDLITYDLEEKQTVLATAYNNYLEKLNWNQATIFSYASIMKLYFTMVSNCAEINYKRAADELLWPFIVTDFERVALGSMQRAVSYNKVSQPRSRSDVSKVLYVSSTTVNGAFIGAEIGSGPGAAVGAAIGFIVGVAQIMLE